MTTHQIEIDGLPDGWKLVDFRPHKTGDAIFKDNKIIVVDGYSAHSYLIVEKIQPSRIVLEETENDNKTTGEDGDFCEQIINNKVSIINQRKIWREVKEGE